MSSLRYLFIFVLSHLFFPVLAQVQILDDGYEADSGLSWTGVTCNVDTSYNNPVSGSFNTSATVMRYEDDGGQYAHVRLDVDNYLDIGKSPVFIMKIYIPSDGITGNSDNKVSVKLQNNNLNEPWNTQTEIIKPLVLDQWQEVIFDFKNDNYINFNGGSPAPTTRTDLNRVLIQINGENNNDEVVAYIDDFSFGYEKFENLVWSDEFGGQGPIDTSNWFHQTRLPNGVSWYNGELQHYTNRSENSYLQDGMLHINAIKETFTDQGQTKNYTSARLNSKFAFQYGRVLIRAKLPFGIGTWPALWSLGINITEPGTFWNEQGYSTTPWPQCGEIDIMEHWGDNQNYISSALHTPSSHGNTVNHGGRVVTDVSSQFHIYELIWTPDELIFKVDDIIHYVYRPSVKDANNWPYDAEQFLLFNVAVLPDIVSTDFSSSAMEVDYVRVYQAEGAVNTSLASMSGVNPQLTIEEGDVLIDNASYGTVMKSPNGNCFRLTVDDDGNLNTALVNCPE